MTSWPRLATLARRTSSSSSESALVMRYSVPIRSGARTSMTVAVSEASLSTDTSTRAGAVGGDDRHQRAFAVEDEGFGQAGPGDQLDGPVGRRFGGGAGPLAGQHRGGALHQLGDETGFPRPPGGRAGGQRVGFGEGGQQLEGRLVPHGGGDREDLGLVGQVAARRALGQPGAQRER